MSWSTTPEDGIDRNCFYWYIETQNDHLQLICGQGFNNLCPTYILPTSLHLFMHWMASLTLSNCLYFHTVCACVEYVWIFLSACLHACTQTALMSEEPAINVLCTIFFVCDYMCFSIGTWCQKWVCVGEPGFSLPGVTKVTKLNRPLRHGGST